MDRKDFLKIAGISVAGFALANCISGCQKTSPVNTNTPVDFTVNTSSGSLSVNGGFLVQNGVIVARTKTGQFIALSAACTHQGTYVNYRATTNDFQCPNHGAQFKADGSVQMGPAQDPLMVYKTTLTGTSLRVFS